MPKSKDIVAHLSGSGRIIRFGTWGTDGWSIMNPRAPGLDDLLHRLRYDRAPLTESERYWLADLVGNYQFLTGYELGSSHCLGKLRDIWRALRKDHP